MEEPQMDKPLATAEQRVAMGDVDAARIIYFVAPYRWQEALFTGWLQTIGHPLVDLIGTGYAVPTVSCTADYLHALRLDDWVRLELRADHIGESSFRVRCDMVRVSDETPCVRTLSSHVWAALADGPEGRVRAEPMPDWLRNALSGGETEGER
jgi:acyl-CoA thioesterase FadM